MVTPAASWSKPGYATVADLVRERTGLSFASGQRDRAEAAIRHCMDELAIASLERYRARLGSDPSAFASLVAELTVGETYFFREPDQFDFIRREIAPALRARRTGLRTWSAGCATGEEAYSLAILLHELGVLSQSRVLGTDLSRERIERAARGSFTRWSLRGVPDEVVRTYFRRRGDRFLLDEQIRRAVSFRVLNLAEAPYPAPIADGMDLVLCRNVLIYLDSATIRQVATQLLASLSEDGWLLLGASDPMLSDLVACEVVVTGSGVAYRRARPARRISVPRQPAPPVAPPPPPRPPLPTAPPSSASARPPRKAPSGPAPLEAAAEAYARREYSHAAELARQEAGKPGSAPELWVLWVRALANQGRLSEAGEACTAALERHRTHAELMYLHATLLSESGRMADAAEALRRALYLDRGLVLAHMALGSALRHLGDVAGARRALRNAERLLSALEPEAPVPASDGETAHRLLELTRTQLRLLGEDT